MVRGRVERVETMVLVLDFRPLSDGESDLAKAAHDVVGDLGERMKVAERATAAGQGEVGRFLGQGGLSFDFLATARESGLEFKLRLIDQSAGSGTVLLRQGTELFHERGEPAVNADPVALGMFERGKVRRGPEFGERGLFQRFDIIQERRHGIVLPVKLRKRHTGKLPDEPGHSVTRRDDFRSADSHVRAWRPKPRRTRGHGCPRSFGWRCDALSASQLSRGKPRAKNGRPLLDARSADSKFDVEGFRQALAALVLSASWATFTSSLNAALSWAARSASTLRSRATFAAFKPSMNRL